MTILEPVNSIRTDPASKWSFSKLLKKWWGYPPSKDIDVNHAHAVGIHYQIIQSKPLLKDIYLKWYREFLPAYQETTHLQAEALELGCGPSVIEEVLPAVRKTDVVKTSITEHVVNAMKLDAKDEQYRALFMVDAFHHISEPSKFLREAARCLKPGGRLVMVEPNNGFVIRWMSKITDHFEYFDDRVTEWKNESQDRMTRANMALAWVVFVRDRKRFERKYPSLKIINIRYHSFISYFVTGGMGYRPFLPSFAQPFVDLIEWIVRPWMRWLGSSMTIDIEKIS
ncbi:MAG: class I SAM-dependent methyltransferase [Patescibacteria group bacterium]